MMNIKKLVIALVMAVTTTTAAFSMEKESIYDNAYFSAGKTYYRLIEEAVKDRLPECDRTRFMNFVHTFPTTNMNNYDLTQKKGVNHPQYEERLFFKNKVDQVKNYYCPWDAKLNNNTTRHRYYGHPYTSAYDWWDTTRFVQDDLRHALHEIILKASDDVIIVSSAD